MKDNDLNQTKILNVAVQCMATYNSPFRVPIDMTLEQAVKYAQAHINEIPVGELNWISDSDEIDVENCYFAEKEKEEE